MQKNTDLMEYKRHRYVLTQKGVLELLNENLLTVLGGVNEATAFLDEVSDKVYEHLLTFPSFREIEYLLGNYEQYREYMQDILKNQARYALRSSGDMIGDMTGLTLRTGSTFTQEQRSSLMISASVEKMINSVFSRRYQWTVSDDEYRVGY